MIPGCVGMIVSHCSYTDQKILMKEGLAPTVNDLLVGDGTTNVSLEKIMSHSQGMQGPQQYFLKDRKYETQSEYRMVWETNRPVKGTLTIRLPELHRYCIEARAD